MANKLLSLIISGAILFGCVSRPTPKNAAEAQKFIDDDSASFRTEQDEKSKALYDSKELGYFKIKKQNCPIHSNTVAGSVANSILSDCSNGTFLRIRIVCQNPDQPNIVDIPFPRKNIAVTIFDRNTKREQLKKVLTPEDGYILVSVPENQKSYLPYNQYIAIEHKGLKKEITFEGAKVPVVIPTEECLKR